MKTGKNHGIRLFALSLAMVMSISCMPALADEPTGESTGIDVTGIAESREFDYTNYRATIGEKPAAQGEIIIPGGSFIASTGTVTGSADGTVQTGSDSTVTWQFSVPSAGYYQLEIEYFPTPSKNGAIERTLSIDGAVPFDEARFIEFSRVFEDGEIKVDSRGNDVMPEQIEKPRRLNYYLHDANSYVSGNLGIYLSEGTHTVSLEANKELLEVCQLRFFPEETLISYADYQKQHPAAGSGKEILTVEAEDAVEKSSFTIYPTTDRSSSATYPQDPLQNRLNVISGDKWSAVGQWITWEVDVPETGTYEIAPRFKQDSYDGGFVSRKLYIDDVCPFEEASRLRFKYANSWTVQPIGEEDKPYLFYLEKGKHTVKMEIVLGDMAEVIEKVQKSLASLNIDYRRILMITGPDPDIYRDYGFEKLIPDVLKDFQKQATELQNAIDRLQALTDVKGDFTNTIGKIIIILKQIEKDPELISELFSTYKDNLSALGTWLQGIMIQPMDIDRIYFVPQGSKVPHAGDSFFRNLWFKIKVFVLSYFADYQSFATEISEEDYANNNVVTVWMINGREQSQIMQKLTEQSFTPETGIKVNVLLVAATALLPSALAGTGPDVAMNLASHIPIDFAIRSAAVDLSKMEGFDEVVGRFHPAAMEPFTFNNSVYAIPETMSFLMMFYRTDIFEELNLKAPKTWDEFYEVTWELQQQKLDIGFPINAKTAVVSNLNLYGLELFLYQQGGTVYNKELTASAMSQDLNVECFEKMSELFTLYRFPVDYDFANRFRSGEMPLGIVEYPTYNQLTIFASEIKGLWKMEPVPGTRQPDGSINYTSPAASTGIMMLKDAKDRKKSWEFIRWVTSDATQSRYAVEVESVLGAAAKQATANLNAMGSMSWTNDEYTALQKQIAALQGTPEIPGGYYTARAIDFAFASVYADGKEPSAALMTQVEMINQEITRKRKEFGFDR
ncbi:MAG: extracellular solute-binding protein [Clostridia bacterium]|nr:extracellular solute-binding protein [Clostridia bacterium]